MRTFTVTAALQFSKNPHPSRRAQPKPIHRSRATPVASRPPLQSERSRPMTLNVVTQSTAFEPSRVMSLLGCAKQGRKTQNNVAFCVPKRFLDRATPPVSRNWDGSESRPAHLDFAPLCTQRSTLGAGVPSDPTGEGLPDMVILSKTRLAPASSWLEINLQTKLELPRIVRRRER